MSERDLNIAGVSRTAASKRLGDTKAFKQNENALKAEHIYNCIFRFGLLEGGKLPVSALLPHERRERGDGDDVDSVVYADLEDDAADYGDADDDDEYEDSGDYDDDEDDEDYDDDDGDGDDHDEDVVVVVVLSLLAMMRKRSNNTNVHFKHQRLKH